MGKQHNGFKKDMDLLSEAYNTMLGGAHMSMGGLAQQAADHMREEDNEHDKTGHLGDEELLDKVVSMGTAGDRLIDAARAQIKEHGSLTPHERDALARDAYGDAEKKIADEDEGAYAGVQKAEARRRDSEDITAGREGFSGEPATPAHQ
tara:strand:+ start:398 stop:844 length:447 start_codon:yes stop_codon:yes gene_type:complete